MFSSPHVTFALLVVRIRRPTRVRYASYYERFELSRPQGFVLHIPFYYHRINVFLSPSVTFPFR